MSPYTGRPQPTSLDSTDNTLRGLCQVYHLFEKKKKVCSAGTSSGLSTRSSSALAGTPLWLCLLGNQPEAGLRAQGAEESRSPTRG